MKTFSGKEYTNESIMSSVGIGMKPVIEDWIRRNGTYWNMNLDEKDLVVNFTDNFERKGTEEITFQIRNAKNIEIENYQGKTFIMPEHANKIHLIRCPKLEKVICKKDCFCEEFIIENCPNMVVDDSFKRLTVAKVTIDNSDIDSLEYFTNVSKSLYIHTARNLHVISGHFNDNLNLYIVRSSIKEIGDFNAKSLYMDDCNNIKSMSFNVPNLQKIHINNCSKIIDFACENNLIDLNISDCIRLKTIKIKDISNNLALKGLPEIENIEAPERISGMVAFTKMPLEPKFNAKKVIIR